MLKVRDKRCDSWSEFLFHLSDAFVTEGPSKTRLMNILMQLRKCVNHPYLFDGKSSFLFSPFTFFRFHIQAKQQQQQTKQV